MPGFILAHMGGFGQWDAVEKYLVGKKVWFDTSYTLGSLTKEQFRRIVKNHGADRILSEPIHLGADKRMHSVYNRKDLTEVETERIFWKNGAELLGLSSDEGKGSEFFLKK
jgi:predicted TIM-barrel fold metal-dependent hydrolase